MNGSKQFVVVLAVLLAAGVAGCVRVPGAAVAAPAPAPHTVVGVVEHVDPYNGVARLRLPWGVELMMVSPRDLAGLRPGDEVLFDTVRRQPVSPIVRGSDARARERYTPS